MAKKTKKSSKRSGRRGDSLATRLAAAQADWAGVEARTFGAPLPDGEYVGTIDDAVIGESRAQRLQCTFTLKVTEGACEGREVRKFSGLETEDNMAFFKGDLETLDLQVPDALTDLGEVLEEAIGMPIRFQVRSRDEFTNIDFIERLEGDGNGGEETEEEEAYTKKDIDAMDEKELTTLGKECDLNADDFETWEDLAEAICGVLEL